MIIIIGSARSGTTWLGKIFDSNPDVFYLHEPDSVLINTEIPFQLGRNELGSYLDETSTYLDQLTELRNIKVTGTLPVFRKNYRNIVMHLARTSQIYAIKAAQSRISRRKFNDWNIADYLNSTLTDAHYVLKSVNSLNRALLFSRAKPDARIIHLVRHPCGQISSCLRGSRLSLMNVNPFLTTLAMMPETTEHGLTLEGMESMKLEEQLACTWMLQNEKTMREMQDSPNYKLVVYEELCENPLETARSLFDFAQIDWHRQTKDFIRRCQASSDGAKRYFQIIRPPTSAVSRWKKELNDDQIIRIKRVVENTLPGQLFQD
jgi:hypothetical protein